jgi:hypothetical protein
MKSEEFFFEYGLRIEDATRNGAPKAFVDRLREYAVAERERTGRSLFGFGWSWWQRHWSPKQEKECLRVYQQTASIRKAELKLEVTCVEVACLAHSVGKLLPEHQHRYRGPKVMTRVLLERVLSLRNQRLNSEDIAKRLGINTCLVRQTLRSSVGSSAYVNAASKGVREKICSLYSSGVVPKRMADHGITASWPNIYRVLREEGLLGICRNNTRGELRKIYLESNFTETKWRAFRRLARRLTEDTYKKHRNRIDPERLRGEDWHLDHKTSVYRAFLLGWTPEKAASLANLQMLPGLINRQKFTGELNVEN